MPIHELSVELVQDIIESYGQITNLNLSTNDISRVENLEHLNCLTSLNLFCNRLGSVPGGLDGLSPLTRLEDLDISENAITSLEPLAQAPVSLVRLNVANNLVADTSQASFLSTLTALTELVLAGNPMAAEEGYRGLTLAALPALATLDLTPREDNEYHRHHADEDNDEGLIPRSIHVSPAAAAVDANSGKTSLNPRAATPLEGMIPPIASGPPHVAGFSPMPLSPLSVDAGSGLDTERVEGGASVRQDEGRGVGWRERGDQSEEDRLSERGPSSPAEPPASWSPASLPSSAEPGGSLQAEDSLQPNAGGGGVFGDRRVTLRTAVPAVCMERPADGEPGEPAERAATGVFGVGEASLSEQLTPGGGEKLPVAGVAMTEAQAHAVSSGAPAATVAAERDGGRGEVATGGGVRLGSSGALDLQGKMGSLPTIAAGAGSVTVPAAACKGGSSLPVSSAALEAAPTSCPLQRIQDEPAATAVVATSVVTAPRPFTTEDEAGDPPEGRHLCNAALRRPAAENYNRVPEVDTTAAAEQGRGPQPRAVTSPGSSAYFEPAMAAAAGAVASEARTHGGPSFPPGGHGMEAGHPPSGPVLPPPQPPGDWRSRWENPVEGRLPAAGGGIVLSRAALGDGGAAAAAPGVQAEGVRTAGESHGALFGDPRQMVSTAAATATAGTGTFPSGIHAAVGPPEIDGNFCRRGPSYDRSVTHDQAPVGAVGWRMRGAGQAVTVMVDRGEWEALRRENDGLRRQAALTEKRCAALVEMQRLANDALASAQPIPFWAHSASSSTVAPAAAVSVMATGVTKGQRRRRRRRRGEDSGAFYLSSSSSASSSVERGPEGRSRDRFGRKDGSEHHRGGDDEDDDEDGDGVSRIAIAQRGDVAKLLAAWRAEVLKLLLQRGADAEAAAAESREARQRLSEEKEARGRAEAEAKSLVQRALAAEAETELSDIKLAHAFEELREDRQGRLMAEASSSGYSLAVQGLQAWVHGFVGRASEGLFEREADLARGVAKLEAFSERLGHAAARIQLLGTLLQHKEVQLRNSRAALVADRRVWLLERRDREHAALSRASAGRPSPVASLASRLKQTTLHPSGGLGEGGGNVSRDAPLCVVAAGAATPAVGDGSGGGGTGGAAWGGNIAEARAGEAAQSPLLEGLRPECEAVMRALFCRVDRLGTGAVRARRLLQVLRSDCGVSEVMEAAVGKSRWRAALDSMETALCPPLVGSSVADSGDGGRRVEGDGGETTMVPCVERDVTWGEFLLFFLPSAGAADDAYNAGLVAHAAGAARRRSTGFGHVSEDAAAMLQMVVPANWTAAVASAERPRVEVGGEPVAAASATVPRRGGAVAVPGGGAGLAALSVGQLRREVLRLARERAFLMALVREDGRLGKRRAEAVHDQYRQELRALHAKIGELERSLEDASRRAEAERERGEASQEEVSALQEEIGQMDKEWKRRLDAAEQEKASAVAQLSREASKAAAEARERVSRLEAEHSLALRKNGKISVRQRALERELARIKSSMQAEAALEKEALEERVRAGDAKLATARRERNALLAALRDLQRRGRPGSDAFSAARPPTELGSSQRGGGGTTLQDIVGAPPGGGGGHRGDGGRVVVGRSFESGAVVEDEVPPGQMPTGFARTASEKRGREAEDVSRDTTVPAAAEPRSSLKGSRADFGGGCEGGGVMELRDFSGQDGEGAGRGTGAEGLGHGGGERAASLSARLESLARQTQQLLEDGSDTSCGSSSGDDDDYG